MSDHSYNPFAFPLVTPNGTIHSPGMTLRDWFAGQALTGILSGCDAAYSTAARDAYAYADVMLEMRED